MQIIKSTCEIARRRERALNYIPRHLSNVVEETARTFPVTLVTGPRQVGKTTLLRELLPDASYTTLDRLDALDSAEQEPERFLRSLSKPAIIDEVQYAPSLFRYVKLEADAQPRTKGRLFLTGSQRFQMMQGVDESLAGRAGIVEMLGLSSRELRRDPFKEPFVPTGDYVERRNPIASGESDVWEDIFRGDLPELAVDHSMSITRYYDSYIETYVRRDVRDLAHVGDLAKFNRFMGILAQSHGQMLNKSDLADKTDASFQTIDRWLSVLEASNIVHLLKPFTASATKRLVKTPKLYFLNSGLAARLCGYASPREIENSQQAGAFFEGYVIAEVAKSFLNASGIMPTLYYYRDSGGHEIDLVIEQGMRLYPVEIKKAEVARPADAKAFPLLETFKGYERQPGAVVCQTKAPLPLPGGVWALPLSYL